MWKNWLRRKRLAQPEPAELRSTLAGDLWQWQYLPSDSQDAAIAWIRNFCAEKYWEGCGGLQLHDYHRWMIAAQASLMTIGMPDQYFNGCRTLLVYPNDYVAPGVAYMVDGQIGVHGEQPRSGQTSYRGPVILNWNGVHSAAVDANEGHSITIHELAHQLDFDNGPSADGLPPLPERINVARWYDDFQAQLDHLRDEVASNYAVLIDDYGLTSLGELWAVSSELYFQVPHELARRHPELFELLLQCYQCDWRRWLPATAWQ